MRGLRAADYDAYERLHYIAITLRVIPSCEATSGGHCSEAQHDREWLRMVRPSLPRRHANDTNT